MEKESVEMNLYVKHFLYPKIDFERASHLAFGDMARRTMKYRGELTDKQKEELKKEIKKSVNEILKARLALLKNDDVDFEAWHESTRNAIVSAAEGHNVPLNHGQAQKWLNMLIKYLYVYDMEDYRFIFTGERIKALHMPIDNKVLNGLKITCPNGGGWSRMSADEYQACQKQIKEALINRNPSESDEKIPFYWELIHWPELS